MMRPILGEPNEPGSSYILVLRGVEAVSIAYLEQHSKAYPTWGCLIFPEFKEELKPCYSLPVSAGIHKVFCDVIYSGYSDLMILKVVKEMFPPYTEDDPVVDYKSEKPSKVRELIEPSRVFNLSGSAEASAANIMLLGADKVKEHLVHTLKGNIFRKLAEDSSYWDVKEIAQSDGSISIAVTLRVAPPEKPPPIFDRIEAAKGVTGIRMDDCYRSILTDVAALKRSDLG